MDFLTPLLLSDVIATFNNDIYREWKAKLGNSKMSLEDMRDFLAGQEERLLGRIRDRNQFVLRRAVKVAKVMVKETALHSEKPPSSFSMPGDTLKKTYAQAAGPLGQSSVIGDVN